MWKSLLNLIYAPNDRFFVAKEYNFTRLFAFSRKWFRCIISIRCMYPNPLFNLLLVFRVSPEGIPETLAFWVRGYGDLFPLVCFFIIQWYVYWSSIVDGSTFFAVFLICPDHLAHKGFLKRPHETIEEKLASISDLGKLVVSPPRWESISKIPETLHIILTETGYSRLRRRADNDSQLFTSFIEIFKKRWSSLDLTSIMREFKRTWPNNLEVMDNLSTLPRF